MEQKARLNVFAIQIENNAHNSVLFIGFFIQCIYTIRTWISTANMHKWFRIQMYSVLDSYVFERSGSAVPRQRIDCFRFHKSEGSIFAHKSWSETFICICIINIYCNRMNAMYYLIEDDTAQANKWESQGCLLPDGNIAERQANNNTKHVIFINNINN